MKSKQEQNTTEQDNNAKLLNLIAIGDEEGAIDLILTCDLKNTPDINGKTPLMHAAEKNRQDLISTMLILENFNNDKSLNARDNKGNTACHYAIVSGDIDNAFAFVIRNGVKAQANNSGQTLLMFAVQKGLHDLIKLIGGRRGIDINAQDNNGNTALHYAALLGDEASTAELIRHKAQFLPNKDGETALMITQKMKINTKQNISPEQELFSLIERGDEEAAIKFFMEHNVDNMQSKNGQTLFMLAAEKGMAELAVSMYKTPNFVKDINQRDNQGNSALVYAVKSGNTNLAIFCIENGALDMQSDTCITAAQNKMYDVVKAAVIIGVCKLNAKDCYGKTLLHYAVENDNDLAILLIQHGANNNASVEREGSHLVPTNLFKIALQNDKHDIVEAMMKQDGFIKKEKALEYIQRYHKEQLVQDILNDINSNTQKTTIKTIEQGNKLIDLSAKGNERSDHVKNNNTELPFAKDPEMRALIKEAEKPFLHDGDVSQSFFDQQLNRISESMNAFERSVQEWEAMKQSTVKSPRVDIEPNDHNVKISSVEKVASPVTKEADNVAAQKVEAQERAALSARERAFQEAEAIRVSQIPSGISNSTKDKTAQYEQEQTTVNLQEPANSSQAVKAFISMTRGAKLDYLGRFDRENPAHRKFISEIISVPSNIAEMKKLCKERRDVRESYSMLLAQEFRRDYENAPNKDEVLHHFSEYIKNNKNTQLDTAREISLAFLELDNERMQLQLLEQWHNDNNVQLQDLQKSSLGRSKCYEALIEQYTLEQQLKKEQNNNIPRENIMGDEKQNHLRRYDENGDVQCLEWNDWDEEWGGLLEDIGTSLDKVDGINNINDHASILEVQHLIEQYQTLKQHVASNQFYENAMYDKFLALDKDMQDVFYKVYTECKDHESAKQAHECLVPLRLVDYVMSLSDWSKIIINPKYYEDNVMVNTPGEGRWRFMPESYVDGPGKNRVNVTMDRIIEYDELFQGYDHNKLSLEGQKQYNIMQKLKEEIVLRTAEDFKRYDLDIEKVPLYKILDKDKDNAQYNAEFYDMVEEEQIENTSYYEPQQTNKQEEAERAQKEAQEKAAREAKAAKEAQEMAAAKAAQEKAAREEQMRSEAQERATLSARERAFQEAEAIRVSQIPSGISNSTKDKIAQYKLEQAKQKEAKGNTNNTMSLEELRRKRLEALDKGKK